MNLTGNNLHFRRQRVPNNTYRILALLIILVSSLFVIRAIYVTREIRSPFLPTAVPTRTASSYADEGETHFTAGNLNQSILAYQQAIKLDSNNTGLMAKLIRIQVYSSAMMATDAEKRTRLNEALQNADAAVKMDPESAPAYAARALTLDWLANESLVGDQWENYLTEASQDAVRARQYDNKNVLAMAYYAEILLDQQQLSQAQQLIELALSSEEKTMDIYRVNGLVMETLGQYGAAIKQYEKATQYTPNFTYLYQKMGVNYRQLKRYDQAMEMFQKAARINEQLNVQDPIPYISIANTYSQTGDFFAAALNVRKALSFDPSSPSTYANLGMVYFKSRNYEGAIDALQCAVRGCNPELSCTVRKCDDTVDPEVTITGMPLSDTTLVYYYTYASALAGMSRSYNDFCQRANEIMAEIRAKYSDDPTTISIISSSEEICRESANASRVTATVTSTLPPAQATARALTPGTPSPTISSIQKTATAAAKIKPTSTATPTVTPTAMEPSPSP
jgi:tetratricopeptide (TPR) repeat protein